MRRLEPAAEGCYTPAPGLAPPPLWRQQLERREAQERQQQPQPQRQNYLELLGLRPVPPAPPGPAPPGPSPDPIEWTPEQEWAPGRRTHQEQQQKPDEALHAAIKKEPES